MTHGELNEMEDEVINYMNNPLKGQYIRYVSMESYSDHDPPPHQTSKFGDHPLEDDTIVVLEDMI
jgi:hypothetical protein